MIGHQRDILATLGIDIWVPKGAACQNMPSSSIWRDQEAAPEYLTEIMVAKTQSSIELAPKAEQLKTLDRIEQLSMPAIAVKEVQAEVVPRIVEERPALPIAAFQLQTFGLPHCIIVIDATELTAEQQQLWNNIQQALHAEYYELQWPFPLINFQDGRGAESYVQGFIDAISADKNIIFLGKFPYFNHAKSIHLAGLQEMLEQPLLKKRLWQFMQKSNQKTDAT
ncbi:hypothetical protein [Acinetobacter sp. TSRC1-2]|uniref:hypothetical protein n=1 Tax=unclassified Acinetobacter TaxID=196816 RepID=UPI003CF3BE09